MGLPRVARIRQRFRDEHIADVPGAVRAAISACHAVERVRPGSRVAITAGSRGIAHIDTIIAAVASELRARGGEPFLVPAMGSHGGATAEGQLDVLAGYGITEQAVGAPVSATMEVVEVGRTAAGVPVYVDRYACESDGIVVVGRVKPHTAFKAPIESGLCKMLVVGLGKQRGAETIHAHGLADTIPPAAEVALRGAPVLLGLAIVENAFEQPYRIVATNPEGFHDTDRQLLQLANRLLPRIPFDHLDVLVVDWIGKNISGSGMDPNVIGIWRRLGGERRPDYRRIVALDLTPESHGNALGIGWADFTTRRLVDSIDQQAMFMNCVTANAPDVGKIPFALADDRAAIEVALKTAARDGASARLARVHSTLHLSELYVSESLVAEVKDNALLEVVAPPAPMQFDGKGRLRPPVLSVQ